MPRSLTSEEQNASTRVFDPTDIPAPESKAPYDFEKVEDPSHGVPSETDLHEANVLPEEPEAATQTFEPGGMKAKVRQRLTDAQARAQAEKAEAGGHPDFADAPDTEAELAQMAGGKPLSKATAGPEAEMKPLKSIDQLATEDAERILGHPPIKPPVVGTMEGKPVQPTTIKVRDTAVPEMKVSSPLEELADLTPANASEKVSKSLLVDDSVRSAYRASVGDQGSVARAMKASMGSYSPAEAIAEGEKTLGTKAAEVLGSAAGRAGTFAAEHPGLAKAAGAVASGAKTLAKGVGADLFSPFTGAIKSGSKGGNIATKMIRGGWGFGKGAAKLTAEGVILPSVLAGEANIIKGELGHGLEDPEDRAGYFGGPGLMGAKEEQEQNLADYNKMANRYGMRVTGTTNPAAMLLGKSTNIQVQEDPALKAAYLRQNKQRIQEILEQQAVSPNVRSNSNQ